MHRVEVSYCSVKDLEAISDSREEVLLKTIAELSCLAYQVTKIPLIQEGKEGLRVVMAETVQNCTAEQLSQLVDLRTDLYFESQAARGSVQSASWAWGKAVGEEVGELEEESRGRWDVRGVKAFAHSSEMDPKGLLRAVFDMAQALGVKNELNLFKFMAEKQRGRIAMGKEHLTDEDKAQEWGRLTPVARECFR